MNPHYKKCQQCGDYKANKDILTIPRRKETYWSDGRVEIFPEMYFCKSHQEDWDLAFDGLTSEEIPEQPEVVYL